MAATFIVEDGSGVEDANAYLEVDEATQFIENYGNSTDWSSATGAQKQNAIREATRYLDLHYSWDGYKVYEGYILQWPRYEMYDEDGDYVDEDIIPERIKQACAYLALKVIEGNTLIQDFSDESPVKKYKTVIGPITEEKEFTTGENPDKSYTIADMLVKPFLAIYPYGAAEIERG
jgi:hypothetical protein